MWRRAAAHNVAGVPVTTLKELEMRPTQKAAIALIAGAIIHAAWGIVGQVVQASTEVSDDLFRYPWTSDAYVALSVVGALAFGLGIVGLAALRASGVAGPTRGARIGIGLALAGSALFVVAGLASIPVRDQLRDEGAASAVGGLFGLATLLLGAGLAAAGVAARRAGLWEGWRPTALLACGLWTLAMLGIVLTPLMPLSVTVMGLLLAAIGVGLLTRPTPVAAGVQPAGATSSIALR
jgi:hypothetical protein